MGPTVPAIPGPNKTSEQFNGDMVACRDFAGSAVAGQANAANQQAVGAGVLTTLAGAGLGAAVGALGHNAGRGAAYGSVVGAGAGTAVALNQSGRAQGTIEQQYNNAFAECMYAKGNMVPNMGR